MKWMVALAVAVFLCWSQSAVAASGHGKQAVGPGGDDADLQYNFNGDFGGSPMLRYVQEGYLSSTLTPVLVLGEGSPLNNFVIKGADAPSDRSDGGDQVNLQVSAKTSLTPQELQIRYRPTIIGIAEVTPVQGG